jgi:hypothetical protein
LITLGLCRYRNLIRHELTGEPPNRVIIPPYAGDDRTDVVLAGVARAYRASEPANEVDPRTIDWFSEGARNMRLRQDPGPQNALGPAKFLFPNNYDVYLHGTNKPLLFAKADRFLRLGLRAAARPARLRRAAP